MPGGSKDSQDVSLIETALRETAEETALDRSRVEVVCVLPRVYTPHNGGTLVSPVVALLRGSLDTLSLSPNPFEVDCLYWVPMDSFLDKQVDNRYIMQRYGKTKGEGVWWSRVSVTHREPETGQTHHIYGLTGSLCVTISAIALNKEPAYHFKSWGIAELVRAGTVMTIYFRPIAITSEQVQPISKL